MIDTNKLPKVLAEFLSAQEKFDSTNFAKTFAANALVHDEGGKFRGTEEIKKWNEETNRKYQTVMEPLAFDESGKESILTIRMSGTFPGSPVIAKFYFVIKNNSIISLRII